MFPRKDCPPQYPDSTDDPDADPPQPGVVTRNRLQEPEAVTIGDEENTWEHPETTDPWNITDG